MKRTNRKFLGGFLAVLGILALWVLVSRNSQTSEISIQRESVVDLVFGIGTLFPEEQFDLKFAVPVNLTQKFVRLGETVKKGTPLIAAEGIGRLSSPIDGVITMFDINVGENIPAQATVLQVTNLKNLYMRVDLEQEAIAKVSKGQSVRTNFDAFPGETFQGRVEAVFSSDSRFIVKIILESLPKGALPGMSSDVAISVGLPREAWVVPAWSVSKTQPLQVLKKSGEKIEVTSDVKLLSGDKAEITSDQISEGDRLLTKLKR